MQHENQAQKTKGPATVAAVPSLGSNQPWEGIGMNVDTIITGQTEDATELPLDRNLSMNLIDVLDALWELEDYLELTFIEKTAIIAIARKYRTARRAFG